MKVHISTAILTLAPLAHAITFRSEVHGAPSRQDASNLRSSRALESDGRDRQDVLQGVAPWNHQNSMPKHYNKPGQGLPVENLGYQAYTTYFGIGTSPPQLMRAFIDRAWSDLIIPAVNCTHASVLVARILLIPRMARFTTA